MDSFSTFISKKKYKSKKEFDEKYVLLDKIGEGGHSFVFKVQNTEIN